MELNPNGLLNAADKTGWSPERVQSHMEALRIINESDIYAQGAAGACDFGADCPVMKLEAVMQARALKNRQKIEGDRLAAFESNRGFGRVVKCFGAVKNVGPPSPKQMAQHSESALQHLRR